MRLISHEGTRPDPQTAWYVTAEPIYAALHDCCDILRSLQSARGDVPLLYLDDLDAMTTESELWLVGHPSPDLSSGKHLQDIVATFSAFGALLSSSGDFAGAEDGGLDARITEITAVVAGATVLRDDWIMRN
jgi:hypothetical protein